MNNFFGNDFGGKLKVVVMGYLKYTFVPFIVLLAGNLVTIFNGSFSGPKNNNEVMRMEMLFEMNNSVTRFASICLFVLAFCFTLAWMTLPFLRMKKFLRWILGVISELFQKLCLDFLFFFWLLRF